MNPLRRSLQTILDPRPRLDGLPGLTGPEGGAPADAPAKPHSRIGVRDILFNFPLLFGGLIVLGLFLTVLFGPLWAPTNPFLSGQHIVPHYDSEQGIWINPPLDPSPEYPLGTDEWGHDILSMLLYGARNTLVACAFITMVRILLGLGLGAYAGWNEGGLPDQLTMGAITLITAIPMLISSMILIYALDIRRGLPVFILALSAIGWTEIAQYIRGEFLILRRMPFIEGARAMGSSNFAIAVRHVLPNLMPQVLVIAFLELGAVLLLLGELSFVGVFIGGGSHIALGDELIGIQVATLIDAPEWGAMLADGYRWLRAKPFIVFPPALAFFIAVVGFNAFGEGLRRLIEKNHLNTNFLLRKRMVLVIAAMSLATVFIINNTGPAPWFAKLARAFDGQNAYEHTRALAEMEGRGNGQPGGEQAAEYIAEKFASYGLKPGWRHLSYVRPFETRLVHPLAQPELAVLGPDGDPQVDFRHQLDFGYQIAGHAGSGQARGHLTFVGFQSGQEGFDWESFQGLDLRGQILLLLEGNAPPDFPTEALLRGAQGILWVIQDDRLEVRSQSQLANPNGRYLVSPTIPVFQVSPSATQTILAQARLTLTDLFSGGDEFDQAGPGWFTRELPVQVEMDLSLSEPQAVEIPSVLGFIPGSDYELADEILVLFANYDGPGLEPDGTIYPGANDNAAGIGMLLEIARLWQEGELNPRRSVLFLAWGGGRLEDPGITAYFQDRRSFSHLPGPGTAEPLTPVAIFELELAGAGGDAVFLPGDASPRLLTLVEGTADQVGVPVFTEGSGSARGGGGEMARVPQAAWISLGWQNGALPLEQDRLDQIDPQKLQTIGELLSRTLTKIVREARY